MMKKSPHDTVKSRYLTEKGRVLEVIPAKKVAISEEKLIERPKIEEIKLVPKPNRRYL